jgi:phasin family protein
MLHCSISTLEAGANMAKSKGKGKGEKSPATKTVAAAIVAASPRATASKAEPAKPVAAAVAPASRPEPAPAKTPVHKTQPAIHPIAPKIVKGSTTMTDQFQQFTQLFAPKGFDQYFAQAQTTKTLEDITKFSKENVDALVTASTLYAKGFENVGKAWYALTQETVEASAAVAKALLGAKTLKEAVDLQTDFAKTTFDKYVAESTKLSELTIKVANEALEPINARVNVAVEKLLKPANAA